MALFHSRSALPLTMQQGLVKATCTPSSRKKTDCFRGVSVTSMLDRRGVAKISPIFVASIELWAHQFY